MRKVYIDYNNHSRSERDDGDGTPYSHSWREYNDYYGYKATLEKRDFGDTHPLIGEDLKPGDNIGIVVIRYSHGDSFGRSEGNEDVLWVGSVEQAGEVRDLVNSIFASEDEDGWGPRRLNIEGKDRYSVDGSSITFPGHERPTYMGTYDDYFGGFDECRVEIVPLHP